MARFKDVAIKAQSLRRQNMNNTETSLAHVGLFEVVNSRHCPQCGGLMEEVDRRKEGPTTYVRFECVKIDCDGRWLQSYTDLTLRQFTVA